MKKLYIFLMMLVGVMFFSSCVKEIVDDTSIKVITGDFISRSTEMTECTATIEADNGDAILQRGICYGSRPLPSLERENGYSEGYSYSTNNGKGAGTFTAVLKNIPEYSTVHYRAYAKTKKGVVYGEDKTFEITDKPRGVITVYASQWSLPESVGVNAVLRNTNTWGNVYYDYCGFIFSTDPDFNSFEKLEAGWSYTQGTNLPFNGTLTGLDKEQTYYVKAYIIYSGMTMYSDNTVTLQYTGVTCPPTVQDRDGNTYSTVQIGSQCWMKENLRTTHYSTGGSITDLTNNTSSWSSTTGGAYCYYEGNASNRSNYGLLYNYKAVETGSLCPEGWHVPTSDEVFTTLSNSISTTIGSTSVGGAMKTTGTSYWNSPNTGATNSSGFSARGGGYRNNSGTYSELKQSGVFWTSSNYNGTYSYNYMLSYDQGDLYHYGTASYDYAMHRNSGLSVRCLKNNNKNDANEKSYEQPATNSAVKAVVE
ncbi:MAG: fibrobacter succinogenes major paralogous domain-containing protein [Bacteroidales bacterium]|nr:fibrobacter succinogenes major paralogous domain-containing protein [Bacteroidales bacterium]